MSERNLKIPHGGQASTNGSVAASHSPATSSHRSSVSTSHGYFLDSSYNNTTNGYTTSAATSPLSFTFQVPMGTPPSLPQSGLGMKADVGSSEHVDQHRQSGGGRLPLSTTSYSYNLQPNTSKTPQGHENRFSSHQPHYQFQYHYYHHQAAEHTYPTESQNIASSEQQQKNNSGPSIGYDNNNKDNNINNNYNIGAYHTASAGGIVSLQQDDQQDEEVEEQKKQHQQQQNRQIQDATAGCGILKPFEHASLLPTTPAQDATVFTTTAPDATPTTHATNATVLSQPTFLPSLYTTGATTSAREEDQHHHRHQISYHTNNSYNNYYNNTNISHHFNHHQPTPPTTTTNTKYYNSSPAAASGGFLQLTPEDQYLQASRAAAASLAQNHINSNNTNTNTNNNFINTNLDLVNNVGNNTLNNNSFSSLPKMPLVIQPQPTLSSLLLPPLALNPVFHQQSFHQHHQHHHHHFQHHHQQPQQQQQTQPQYLPPLPPRQRKNTMTYQRLTRANVAAIDSKDSRQARWHRVLSYVAQVRSSFAQGEINGSNSPTSAWISHQERIVRSSPDEDLIDPMMDPLWATQPLKRRRSLWDGGSCGTDGVDQFVWDDELDSGGNRFTLPPRSQQGDANENRVGGESPVSFTAEACPTSSSTGSRRKAMEIDQEGEEDRPSKRARSMEGLGMSSGSGSIQTNNNSNTLKVSNANISKTHALALEQYLETLRTIEKSRLPMMKRAMDVEFDYSLGATTDTWRQVYVA